MTEQLERRIRAYVEKLDPAVSGQHGHDTTLRAACVLVQGFGLGVDQAWPFALEYNSRCMPPWPERDLRRKLGQALIRPGDKPRGYLLGLDTAHQCMADQAIEMPARPSKPKFQPQKLATVARRLSDDISAEYLEARSKYTCWNRTPGGFLHKLYHPGEKVVVFNVFESQGCEVWQHPGVTGNLASLNYLRKGEVGVWYMANPVDGEYHWNPREQKQSRRSEESVTCWRYLVIESDDAPADLWLKALVQMPLRISSIYTSGGGTSVHSLVRIDATSKAHWDSIVRVELFPILVSLGADPGALTAVRLTRLPNCMREQKKQLQRLLYLNDAPAPIPICKLPIRETPEAARLRWSTCTFAPEDPPYVA